MYLDVKRPRVEGEDRTEETWVCDLGCGEGGVTLARPDQAQATRVSSRQDMVKESQTIQLYKQNLEENFEPYETNLAKYHNCGVANFGIIML